MPGTFQKNFRLPGGPARGASQGGTAVFHFAIQIYPRKTTNWCTDENQFVCDFPEQSLYHFVQIYQNILVFGIWLIDNSMRQFVPSNIVLFDLEVIQNVVKGGFISFSSIISWERIFVPFCKLIYDFSTKKYVENHR